MAVKSVNVAIALTKSGHAYIPIDDHSALEKRVTAIVSRA